MQADIVFENDCIAQAKPLLGVAEKTRGKHALHIIRLFSHTRNKKATS